MTIKPLNDNIIIEVNIDKRISEHNGILLVNKKEIKDTDTGVVVAIGEGRLLNDGTLIKPSIKVGDTVIFEKLAYTEIKTDDKEKTYFIIKENNITCIL